MSDPISAYQLWKKQGGDLRARAKQAMEARFRELLLEAVQLAEEYRADFGAPLSVPSPVTTFRYKAGKRRPQPKAPTAKSVGKEKPPAAPPDPRIAAIQKQLSAARKRLKAAQAKGGPLKNLEDRVYELEDDLRLAAGGGEA